MELKREQCSTTNEEGTCKHVIVGAGPIGTATAQHLLELGHEVTVVTRSGTGPEGTRRVAADAADRDRLTELARGAQALYNCANPRYHRWPTDWPPVAAAMLAAAEQTGAGLVTMSNLYGYGPVDVPMTEDLPLAATTVKGGVRARMWRDALAAQRTGPGQGHRGPGERLRRRRRPVGGERGRAAPGPDGSAGVRAGRLRPAAQPHLHRGRGPAARRTGDG